MLTVQGQQTYNLVKASGLSSYYCKHLGNIQIPQGEFNAIQHKVMAFLINNPEWVMGIQEDGFGEYIVYITQIQYL